MENARKSLPIVIALKEKDFAAWREIERTWDTQAKVMGRNISLMFLAAVAIGYLIATTSSSREIGIASGIIAAILMIYAPTVLYFSPEHEKRLAASNKKKEAILQPYGKERFAYMAVSRDQNHWPNDCMVICEDDQVSRVQV